MRLKTEEILKTSRILFLFKKPSPLVDALEKTLLKYQSEIFKSVELPKRVDHFDYIFIFDDKYAIDKLLKLPLKTTNALIILYDKTDKLRQINYLIHKNHLVNIKVINTNKEIATTDYIERILWFLYSSSPEKTLDLARGIKKKLTIKTPLAFSFHINKKKLLLFLMIMVLLLQFFFLLPLLGSFYFLRQGTNALKKSNLIGAEASINSAKPLVSLSNHSYQLSRPVFSFFYLALFPDDLLLLQNSYLKLLQTSVQTMKNGQKTVSLILEPEKSDLEKQEVHTRINLLKKEVTEIIDQITIVSNKISGFNIKSFEKLNQELVQVKTSIEQIKKMLGHVDELIGTTREKKYLVLFQNNMELRPGGGFIGSFALLTFANYSLKDFKVEDVYEADGQLKAHIEPPYAIKTYLNQPHWFLRDSNFSPDFEKNFKNAEFFLYKELGLSGIDGGIAVSTTAISYMIESFGKIYLPDYDETITSKNFYIKTQIHSQENFFPGSKQKKNFLSTLVDTLLLKLETVYFGDLGLAIKRALDEKQIVLYFKDENIQKDIDLLGFGGRIAIPHCAQNNEAADKQCIVDTVFPVDANVGVNKANFFIKKLINIKTTIDEWGKIEKLYTEVFQNDSASDVFPGGTYKNYFQLYLPKDSTVKKVIFDGKEIDNYEEISEEPFKIIALYFEVLPKTTSEFKIMYQLDEVVAKPNVLYQLVMQKQIGDTKSDVILQFYYPQRLKAKTQNFSAVAKTGSLVYNTSLSNDRIFFVEFSKK